MLVLLHLLLLLLLVKMNLINPHACIIILYLIHNLVYLLNLLQQLLLFPLKLHHLFIDLLEALLGFAKLIVLKVGLIAFRFV